MTNPIVLAVDDDPSLLKLMVRRLDKLGLQIEQASDGRSAMELIENNSYDLVVTDIYMPGVTGLELLKQAKERDQHTQVIVVTAAATMENAVEALNNGAFAYLTKPFDHMTVFDNVVSRALDYRRLMLDNLRMAEIQRRRGDMLEEEVTERVIQLQKWRRETLDLIACLPDGVVVVEPGGRIIMTNPKADHWLAMDEEDGDRPLHKYLETVHEEWTAAEWEVELGEIDLILFSSDLPDQNGKERKVVVMRYDEAGSKFPDITDSLVELKHGLAWLYNQDVDDRILGRVALMAKLVADLEEIVRSPETANGIAKGSWSAVTEDVPVTSNDLGVEEPSESGEKAPEFAVKIDDEEVKADEK